MNHLWHNLLKGCKLRHIDASFLWEQYMFGAISKFFKNLIDERNIWLANTKNIPNVAPILNVKK
jgi:hypothetical protein